MWTRDSLREKLNLLNNENHSPLHLPFFFLMPPPFQECQNKLNSLNPSPVQIQKIAIKLFPSSFACKP